MEGNVAMKNKFNVVCGTLILVFLVSMLIDSISCFRGECDKSDDIAMWTRDVKEMTEFNDTEFYALSKYSDEPSKFLEELMKYTTEDLESGYPMQVSDYMVVLQKIHEGALLAESNDDALRLIRELIPHVDAIAESIDTRIEYASTLLKVHKTSAVVTTVLYGLVIFISIAWLYC